MCCSTNNIKLGSKQWGGASWWRSVTHTHSDVIDAVGDESIHTASLLRDGVFDAQPIKKTMTLRAATMGLTRLQYMILCSMPVEREDGTFSPNAATEPRLVSCLFHRASPVPPKSDTERINISFGARHTQLCCDGLGTIFMYSLKGCKRSCE